MSITRKKLNEASYFLNQMKATVNNQEHFLHNLSACISALRSITFFMQKEFAHVAGFPTWYTAKQAEIKADKMARFFNEQRKLTVHEKQIETTIQYQYYSPVIDTWKLKSGERISFKVTTKVEDNGTPTIHVTDIVDTAGAIVAGGSTETQWLFDELPKEDNPQNKDVVTLCEGQLTKMQSLVEECERTFSPQV